MPNSINIIRNPTGSNQDITSAIQRGSIQLTSVITKEVGTLSFNIEVTPATTSKIPSLNDEVALWINGVNTGLKYFGGIVTGIETTVVGGILLVANISCTDWSFVLNKKVVAKNYAGEDPGNIVKDLITSYAPAGFNTAAVQMGNFFVPSIKFNYEQLFNCLQKLATLIGWNINIDPNKNVQFFLDGAYIAPFGIDDVSGNQIWNTIDWNQDLLNMKNSIYVVGSTYKKVFTHAGGSGTYAAVDVYTSVGGTFVYPLAYAYNKSAENGYPAMVVKLNGVSQTIGTADNNQPGSYQVLYSDRGRYIQFTSDPGSGNSIEVTGTANVPITAYASDPGAIATYGQIDESIVDKQITTVQEAFMRAQAEVKQFGHGVNNIKFSTLVPGLFPGQHINFNSAKFLGVFSQSTFSVTIKRITATDYSNTQLLYQVECIGSDQVTFNDIMSVLLQQENMQNPVDDSTVTQTLVPVAESLPLADAVSATGVSGPYKWGPNQSPNLKWGFFTWN